MTDTPTPRAAILDRITEAEVAEWLAETLRKIRADRPELKINFIDSEVHFFEDQPKFELKVYSSVFREFGRSYSHSVSEAVAKFEGIVGDAKNAAEAKRRQAAALIAEAEALEAEGAK